MVFSENNSKQEEENHKREEIVPHKYKLETLLKNEKLDEEDKDLVKKALERYEEWIKEMSEIKSEGDEKVLELVKSLNDYKLFFELEVIWDSKGSFLYRQKGQTKIDNSILEEFFPWLICPTIIPSLKDITYQTGPRGAFSGTYFSTSLAAPEIGGGLKIRTKNQDFTISRPVYLKSSWDSSFPKDDTLTYKVIVAFIAAECKTNLDKTMYQEAAATAHDLRMAVPGARYYLLCEWLDMTPISTESTDIEEVIILRGKRLGSNKRKGFVDNKKRVESRDEYEEYLLKNPIRHDSVLRFVNHLREVFDNVETIEEESVLKRGYF